MAGGHHPPGDGRRSQSPIKLCPQSACVCFGGSLHGARAPPAPPVGGQSCLHLGRSLAQRGCHSLRPPPCSGLELPKVQMAPGDGALGSVDGSGGEGASMLPSPALGVFCSEVLGPMGFSRRVTGVFISYCRFMAIKQTEPLPQPRGTQL